MAKSKMKILFISGGDNGGGSWWLSEAINKYTNHIALSARKVQTYLNYPCDFVNPDDKTMISLARWADVIHVREGAPRAIQKFIKNKKKVVTFTGMSYRRKCNNLVTVMRKHGYFVTVSTSDLIQYYKASNDKPVWIPNPREKMIAIEKHSDFTVCHAPTFRERKGTESVIEACKIANVKLELIENTNYRDCVYRKSKCHLVIDQFAWGYGNNAIEAWSMDIPTIGNALDESYKHDIHKELSGGNLPYMRCEENAQAIADCIIRLRDNKEVYDEQTTKGLDYFYKYHHMPVVAKRLVEIYEGL